jgi:hypothetical protein
MNAICGFIFPVAIERKSESVKEKVASGFPSYGPAHTNQPGPGISVQLIRSTKRCRKRHAHAHTFGDLALLEVDDEDLLVDSDFLRKARHENRDQDGGRFNSTQLKGDRRRY